MLVYTNLILYDVNYMELYHHFYFIFINQLTLCNIYIFIYRFFLFLTSHNYFSVIFILA